MSHGSQKVDTDVLAAKFKGVEGADMDLKELFKIHKGLETQLSSIDPNNEEAKEKSLIVNQKSSNLQS